MSKKEPFSSEEKSQVRDQCLQLVKALNVVTQRPLSYFGLPSPWMRDIRVWRPYLDQVVAVEMDERFIPDLLDRAYVLGVFNQLTYYVGDIDSLLQSGNDHYGHALSATFPVDIVNLDYCSGLVYEGFERITAIESLFRLQAKCLNAQTNINFPYFLLFITHKCHPTAGKQKVSKEYITYLTREARIYQDSLREQVEALKRWYTSNDCPLEYRHKAFVIGKVLEFGQSAGFRIAINSVISYKGDADAPMLHYQFLAHPISIGHPIPVDSHVHVIDILNFPVVTVEGLDIGESTKPVLD